MDNLEKNTPVEMIVCINHFDKTGTIQYWSTDLLEWVDLASPSWDFNKNTYRVKPEYDGPYVKPFWSESEHKILHEFDIDGKYVTREDYDSK